MNRFDLLNEWIRNTESSIVNFISVFAPWLAPLTPAYMTYQHSVRVLEFPHYIAIPAALLVEILGFSAVSTFLAFWFHNRKNQANIKRAPIEVVVFAFAFYLSLIIFSNVLLDSFPSERWAEITVRALFTLQTIPAALIVAVRTQHRDLLSEIKKEKVERRQNVSESSPKDEQKPSESFGKFPKDWRQLEPTLTYEQTVQIASLNSEQVKKWAHQIGVSEKTITNWRAYANEKLEQLNEQ